MYLRKIILLLSMFIVLPISAEIKTEVFYDSTYLRVGEVLHYQLDVYLPPRLKVVGLQTNSYKVDINISIKTNLKRNIFSASGSIQNFEIENFFFPGFVIKLRSATKSNASFTLGKHYFHVLKPKVDLSKKPLIRKVKAPFELPTGFPWGWFILIFSLAGLLLALYLLKKKKDREKLIPGFESKKDAYLIVLERLATIKVLPFGNHLEMQAFYFLLTETLKIYLTRRTTFHFLEATTGEIANLIKDISWVDVDLVEGLLGKLQDADFVKFAKYTPPVEDAESFFSYIENVLADLEASFRSSLVIAEQEGVSHGV